MAKKVFVGLSGGVDSSVTAALLKEQGYDVTGVYMKNWSQDLPGFPCPWKQDYQDAKRVAVQLNIPFKMYDFETDYRHKVVDYMVKEYQAGRTPNPDVMCNQEVKFKLFLETALEDGADLIATGHYARILRAGESSKERVASKDNDKTHSLLPTSYSAVLCAARNRAKDQTYFLYRVTEEALKKTLFPIGEFKDKHEVRALAKKFGLVTADKKDSQGICFVGQVGIKEFLQHELGLQKPGDIVNQAGKVIGQHEGAIYYTIGQRHGLNVGGGLPYYVTGKDMDKNIVYVTTDLNDKNLWTKDLKLTNFHLINSSTTSLQGLTLQARVRYGAPLVECEIKHKHDVTYVTLKDEVRAATPGQSVVIYEADHVLGGGIING